MLYTGFSRNRTGRLRVWCRNVRGRKSAQRRLGWKIPQWPFGEEETPVSVVCPGGQKGRTLSGKKEERRLVHFSGASKCRTYPLQDECRVALQKRTRAAIRVTNRVSRVVLLRQRLRPEDRPHAEATTRSLHGRLRKDKLLERGRFSAVMPFIAVAPRGNLRRVHAYLAEPEDSPQQSICNHGITLSASGKNTPPAQAPDTFCDDPRPENSFRSSFERIALAHSSPSMGIPWHPFSEKSIFLRS